MTPRERRRRGQARWFDASWFGRFWYEPALDYSAIQPSVSRTGNKTLVPYSPYPLLRGLLHGSGFKIPLKLLVLDAACFIVADLSIQQPRDQLLPRYGELRCFLRHKTLVLPRGDCGRVGASS